MKITPRPYQNMAVKAALKGLRSHFRRALVVLATGLGKTLTAAFITKKIRAKRILFLVHNNFILDHAVSEFRLVFNKSINIAIYNGVSQKGAKHADIVFATWQTMRTKLKQWSRNHFDLIIVDEAHHERAETYRPVTEYFTGRKLGITATPDREDEADIREVFGPEVVNITLEEAIAKGWLPRIEYHVITDQSLDDGALQKIAAEIRKGKKRFTMAEVNRRIFIKKRDVEVARIINRHKQKALIFCQSVFHAERLAKVIDNAETLHCSKGKHQYDSWTKNQETLDFLNKGTVRRVCAVNVLNEGVNVPSVGLVAFCRVTGVLNVFRQQLGRGLRPGKDKLIVLDFVGNLERIQLLLETMNRIEQFRFNPNAGSPGGMYQKDRFEVSGKGFEFTFSDQLVDLVKVLDHCHRDFYPTWQEASFAAIKLGIDSFREYKDKYTQDSKLPCNPHSVYRDFPGYGKFLGKERNRRDLYKTWEKASTASRKLGITTPKEYSKLYKKDPRLPSAPDQKYADFPGWPEFLRDKFRDYYPTWQQASVAVRKLGIKKVEEYRKRCREDQRLPLWPCERMYPGFPGMRKFLGTNKEYYKNWSKASIASRKLKIKSRTHYKNQYKLDEKLPADPGYYYDDFPGWNKFLGTQRRR